MLEIWLVIPYKKQMHKSHNNPLLQGALIHNCNSTFFKYFVNVFLQPEIINISLINITWKLRNLYYT